jgi:hypothetical protein
LRPLPIFKLRAGDSLWRSRRHAQTLDPKWDEATDRASLQVAVDALVVHCLLWDWDRLAAMQYDYLGTALCCLLPAASVCGFVLPAACCLLRLLPAAAC